MPPKIKVLGLPGDKTDGACASYRVIWPLQALEATGRFTQYIAPIVKRVVPPIPELQSLPVRQVPEGQEPLAMITRPVRVDRDGRQDPSIPNLVNNYDIVVLQRQPEADVSELIKVCKRFEIKVVFDIDDAALSIPAWNPNYVTWGRDRRRIMQMVRGFYASGFVPNCILGKSPEEVADLAQTYREGILRHLRWADLVTVTTEALADEYQRYNSNIQVCPNQMHLGHWADLEPIPHPGRLWIGWAGGWTHAEDLAILKAPMQQILQRHADVDFVLVGFDQAKKLLFSGLPEDRVLTFPWEQDFRSYHSTVASLDVVLAPSKPCQFNEGKSDIRVMEAWLCGLPCVASPTTYGQTIRASGGGLVANKTKDWLKALERLIQRPGLRRQMGARGKQYVIGRRTYEHNVGLWQRAYLELFEGD